MKGVLGIGAAVVLAATATAATAGESAGRADCTRTSVGLKALTDLRAGTYHGFRGGLYPGGQTKPSAAYLKTGMAYVAQVKPRGADGTPQAGGRIVLLSIGMSNTTQEFSAFKRLADADPQKSARLTIVDGAQGGQDAVTISEPGAAFWSIVDQRLAAAGVSSRQVQVAWLKEAIIRPTESFPADAKRLQGYLRTIVGIMRGRYPNLRLIYLSNRTYAGYAVTPLNPEPYAYQSGFAVKWTVQDRIERKLTGPWLGWGPDLWTDGTRGRADGFTWTCEDVRRDGTHPSRGGQQKIAGRLLAFFKREPTAKSWFVR